jgi:hypothetical protein
MTSEATLADMVIRETLRGTRKSTLSIMNDRSPESVRAAMLSATRFALDDEMSAFLADLSITPFAAHHVRQPDVLDSMRHGALLPFPATWVEFNGIAFRRRLIEIAPSKYDLFGEPLGDVNEVPVRWGWLLEQHPQLEHCVRLTEYVDLGGADPLRRYEVGGFPFSVVWNCKDEPLPWHADTQAGMLMHGIPGFHSPYIGVVMDRKMPKLTRANSVQVKTHDNDPGMFVHSILVEMSGLVRYALAFLSTLNDVPTIVDSVTPSRGYFAKGRYRKFVEHKKVRLNIPQRVDRSRFARKVLALSRRRWHPVRAHWRLHARPGDELCPHQNHEWQAMGEDKRAPCKHCAAWRTWIVLPQGRGDASLAMALHSFEVTHHAP